MILLCDSAKCSINAIVDELEAREEAEKREKLQRKLILRTSTIPGCGLKFQTIHIPYFQILNWFYYHFF